MRPGDRTPVPRPLAILALAALPDLGRATKARLEEAMRGHVLAQAELVGTCAKKGR